VGSECDGCDGQHQSVVAAERAELPPPGSRGDRREHGGGQRVAPEGDRKRRRGDGGHQRA
jgi:hypothetical protein